jgi:UDP-N-acetylmuramyl pentapeptide synthase
LAAVAVGCVFGVGLPAARRALAAFDFPKSRLIFKKVKQISFIDDTYNSNPLSLQQAMATLDSLKVKGRKILVMGDMLELGTQKEFYHTKAGKEAKAVCDVLVTLGELSRLTADAAKACGFDSKNVFTCSSCNEVKEVLFKVLLAQEDDVVLVKGSRSMRMEEIFT